MSTEHQKYSTANQADAIAAYAAKHNLAIVRTYLDEGRSGLRINGRAALQQLISDVTNQRADYGVVLVYDVSRWGRFLDTDESAHYEFTCKKVGIKVQYCAEQFENDGGLVSTILKNMKRAMASEYSRELSAKIFASHCRLKRLGLRQGSPPGCGSCRELVDPEWNRKASLGPGEYKGLRSDRVVLKPGPAHEVEIVRRIYEAFVYSRKSEAQIADALNRERIPYEFGRPWNRLAVRMILTNEKYIGNNVYNRASFKLKQIRVKNPPEAWIRAENAFEAVVDSDLFIAAGKIINERTRRYSSAEALNHLASLLAEKGRLTRTIIDEIDEMPSSQVYYDKFGSLLQAYRQVGYGRVRIPNLWAVLEQSAWLDLQGFCNPFNVVD